MDGGLYSSFRAKPKGQPEEEAKPAPKPKQKAPPPSEPPRRQRGSGPGFFSGLLLGLAMGLLLHYFYLGRPVQPPEQLTKPDYPQAIAAAINEVWGLKKKENLGKKYSGYYPLLIGMELSSEEESQIQNATPRIEFTFVDSWDEIDFNHGGKETITTVISDIALGEASGRINAGFRAGTEEYVGVTYLVEKHNLVWTVVRTLGELENF